MAEKRIDELFAELYAMNLPEEAAALIREIENRQGSNQERLKDEIRNSAKMDAVPMGEEEELYVRLTTLESIILMAGGNL